MKAFLKADPTRFGVVEEVWCAQDGQKRVRVALDDSGSIEGDVAEFEFQALSTGVNDDTKH